jgi:KDO2-lipid IV(A) lauroyltransferase
MLSRLLVALLWLLHFLPLAALAFLGRTLGLLLFGLAGRRRHIVLVNLRLCFPELDEAQRRRLAKEHFKVLGRSMLERSLLWWASAQRLAPLLRVSGEEQMRQLLDAGRPVLMLTPHFVGLDAGGAAIAMRFDSASIYAVQSDPVFDASCTAVACALAINCCSRARKACAPASGR